MAQPADTRIRQEAIRDFLTTSGHESAQVSPLAGDASFRRYMRVLSMGKPYILMDAPPDKEDIRPFITIGEYLYDAGFSAPHIIARDMDRGFLLLEDLGDDLYSAVIRRDGETLEKPLYSAAVDLLVRWHDAAEPVFDADRLLLPVYDDVKLMQEIGLFAEWFLPRVLSGPQLEDAAQEYLDIWRGILAQMGRWERVWVHRDYHADNLLWMPDREGHKKVGLLDFQDGVYGDAAYDLVSLLEDARRDVSTELAFLMRERYIRESGVPKERFLAAYAVLAAQRNSKIIGIFTRLAARDGKYGYLRFLPRVWAHLEEDIRHPLLAPLERWLNVYIPASRRCELPRDCFAA